MRPGIALAVWRMVLIYRYYDPYNGEFSRDADTMLKALGYVTLGVVLLMFTSYFFIRKESFERFSASSNQVSVFSSSLCGFVFVAVGILVVIITAARCSAVRAADGFLKRRRSFRSSLCSEQRHISFSARLPATANPKSKKDSRFSPLCGRFPICPAHTSTPITFTTIPTESSATCPLRRSCCSFSLKHATRCRSLRIPCASRSLSSRWSVS